MEELGTIDVLFTGIKEDVEANVKETVDMIRSNTMEVMDRVSNLQFGKQTHISQQQEILAKEKKSVEDLQNQFNKPKGGVF